MLWLRSLTLQNVVQAKHDGMELWNPKLSAVCDKWPEVGVYFNLALIYLLELLGPIPWCASHNLAKPPQFVTCTRCIAGLLN